MDVQRAQGSSANTLYNDESCYQITIIPSKIKNYGKLALPFVVAVLATLLLTSFRLYSQLLFFIITLLLLLNWQKVSRKSNRFTHTKKITLPDYFSLGLTGGCTFTNIGTLEKTSLGERCLVVKQDNVISITLQLSCRSRVSFLGCWLYFDKNEQKKIVNMNASVLMLPQPWFIFRDSLSKQDFSRLARVLNSLSIIQHKAKSKLSKND
ncbi:MAG: hypothetical protein JKX78_02105 [Alteromonadaceae bacterium]|nr:hypothetical protein [Alteromonadaceae bacterium]